MSVWVSRGDRRSGGAAGEDAADVRSLLVAVPVEDGVQVVQVGLAGVGSKFALEGPAGGERAGGLPHARGPRGGPADLANPARGAAPAPGGRAVPAARHPPGRGGSAARRRGLMCPGGQE